MMWLIASLLGCAPSVPASLLQELSAIHEVPSEGELVARYPRLVHHLQIIAQGDAYSPIAQSRAWTLLAESTSPEALATARLGAIDPTVPGAVRYKILRRLTHRHPEVARNVMPAVWCDEAPLVRRATREADLDVVMPPCP